MCDSTSEDWRLGIAKPRVGLLLPFHLCRAQTVLTLEVGLRTSVSPLELQSSLAHNTTLRYPIVSLLCTGFSSDNGRRWRQAR